MDATNLLFVWLAASIALFLSLQTVLSVLLRRQGVKTHFFWVGTPGYLDSKYVALRNREGKSYALLVALRIFSGLSVIISAIAVIGASP